MKRISRKLIVARAIESEREKIASGQVVGQSVSTYSAEKEDGGSESKEVKGNKAACELVVQADSSGKESGDKETRGTIAPGQVIGHSVPSYSAEKEDGGSESKDVKGNKAAGELVVRAVTSAAEKESGDNLAKETRAADRIVDQAASTYSAAKVDRNSESKESTAVSQANKMLATLLDSFLDPERQVNSITIPFSNPAVKSFNSLFREN